jgi:hypothetical protein
MSTLIFRGKTIKIIDMGLDIYAFENAPAMGRGTVISKTNDLRISHPEVKND